MKKKIIILLCIILLIASIISSVIFFTTRDTTDKYTIEEEQWVEKNKGQVVDLYMPSDMGILTLNEDSLLFDFANTLKTNTGLNINPVAYQISEVPDEEYSILIVDKAEKDDIKILEDEYVLISKKDALYNSTLDIKGLKIGVLKDDFETVKAIMGIGNTYYAQNSKELMLNYLENNKLDAVVCLKSYIIKDVLDNNYYINYHLYDYTKKFVLRTKGDSTLSNIIKKEYLKYKKSKFKSAYNSSLLSLYINEKEIQDKDLVKLNSKKYTYGYISNGLFDNTSNNKLVGTNYNLIKAFSYFANIDMKYENQYTSIKELNNAYKKGKIDFYFDNTPYYIETENKVKTSETINSKIVYLTKNNTEYNITSINSLKDKKVSVLKNTKIEKYLIDNGINVISYNSYKDMLKPTKLKKSTIIATDMLTYEYYKTRGLNNYYINYIDSNAVNYGFVAQESDELFVELFDFFMRFSNVKTVGTIDKSDIYEYEGLNIFLLILVIIMAIILIIQFFGKIKQFFVFLIKSRKNTLSKNEKLKYIDNLTSLKNRTYLNDNIEKWDNSEIYPQVIIVVDLNNVAYINDNFGHEEGDKLITEAANILIQTQMPKSEIIRTDGNEFLIYMVEYEEKKAVSYIRKLNKEFKNLSHGFGAAIGYSIINDAIKTIDDAVNEATLDMKTNKELMNEEEK